MSSEEHYFENLLFAFARGGNDCYDKAVENDDYSLEIINSSVKRLSKKYNFKNYSTELTFNSSVER